MTFEKLAFHLPDRTGLDCRPTGQDWPTFERSPPRTTATTTEYDCDYYDYYDCYDYWLLVLPTCQTGADSRSSTFTARCRRRGRAGARPG